MLVQLTHNVGPDIYHVRHPDDAPAMHHHTVGWFELETELAGEFAKFLPTAELEVLFSSQHINSAVWHVFRAVHHVPPLLAVGRA